PQFVLPLLGLSLSVGSLAGAWHIWFRIRGHLPRSRDFLARSFLRTGVASLVMVGPAYLITVIVRRMPHTHLIELAGMFLATVVGIATFLGVQMSWRAPELDWFKKALARNRSGL